MKKSGKVLMSILAVAVIGANVGFSSMRVKADDATLANLEALQSTAGEAYCDQSHPNSCTMRVGSITGYSTGNAIIIN